MINEYGRIDENGEVAGVRPVEFNVTICLGYGDGGTVEVSVDVTDEEYELMKDCYRDGDDMEDIEELEDMLDRVKQAARDENDFCSGNGGADDDDDTEDEDDEDDGGTWDDDEDTADYIIEFPDEVIDEVDAESRETD